MLILLKKQYCHFWRPIVSSVFWVIKKSEFMLKRIHLASEYQNRIEKYFLDQKSKELRNLIFYFSKKFLEIPLLVRWPRSAKFFRAQKKCLKRKKSLSSTKKMFPSQKKSFERKKNVLITKKVFRAQKKTPVFSNSKITSIQHSIINNDIAMMYDI